MGVVYKAEDVKLRRPVALKFLPPEMTRDDAARHRFIQEARAASALDHPNIAVVHEIDETDDGRSFICMAYYDGETLKEKIERGPLEVGQAIEIALQIADGLQRAHDAGIIHRDIKPANVIITEQGVAKIVDFGLAKLAGLAHSTTTGQHAGTAAYMSPEQVLGKAIDHRSDLFSLGIVFYEMVTGKRPFEGEHQAALFYTIVNLDPDPLSIQRAGIPDELARIILKLLQKDPSKRYQSANGLRADLISLRLGARSGSASRTERLVTAVKSHKLTVALVFLIVPAVGLFLTSILSHSTISLESSDYAVVADFDNNTNDKVFDHSLTEAMKVSLRQSAHLNLLSPESIMNALERMELPKDRRLGDSLALSVARREGARVVIAGSIGQLGSSYLISCKIIDAASGEVLNLERRKVPQIENVLSEMDQLCEQIRRRLGESLRDISNSAMPLEKVTTSSLEALELFSRGSGLQGQGDYRGAAFLMEQAVAIDSNFVSAVSDLSYCYRKLGNDSLALAFHKRVLPLVGRATDRERYYILSVYYGPSFEFDLPKANESIQELVARYPNSADGFATLGWLAMYAGDTRAAIEANEKALSLDSTHAGNLFDNTGYAFALAGNAEKALEFYRKSKRLRQTYYAIDSYMAQAWWIKGEFDSAEATFQSILPVSDAQRKIMTHMELASLYYFEGRLQRARDECWTGVALCQTHQRSSDEAYFHCLLGEFATELGNWETYGTEMKKAEELSASPFPELPLIGMSYARYRKPGDAVRILKTIMAARSADPYFLKRRMDYFHFVNGEIMLRTKQAGRAIDEFHSVQEVQSGDALYLLAQLGVGRAKELVSDTSALTIYRSVLDRRGEVVMANMRAARNSGVWISNLWPELDLTLARNYLRMHDQRSAGRYLHQCMQCWNKADGSYMKSRAARELLAELTKGR